MISLQESNIIKWLRTLAMFLIVLCHIQQAYDIKWAWVFNVGVQIFLAISAWLYGNKNIIDWKRWYFDKFRKLYIPYIIYVVIVFLLYRIGGVGDFSFKSLLVYIIDAQWFLGDVKGLSHLWFMTAIALCYFFTPVLQFIREKGYISFFLLLLSIIGLFVFFYLKMYLSIFSCLFIYSFVYLFISLRSRKSRRVYVACMLLLFIYVWHVINWDILLDYSNYKNQLFHLLMGVMLVIVPTGVVNYFSLNSVPNFISIFDKYSYYVYITHHIFLLGPFSLAFITNSIYLNVMM